MALVNIPLSRRSQFEVEWTVVGEERPGMVPGDIRWTGWNKTCVPPQLSIEFESHDGKRVAAKRIQISSEYQGRGWNTLRDLYEADPERKENWADWVAFCDAQKANPLGMKGKTFPEDKLPKSVQAMRNQSSKAMAEAAAFRFADGSGLDSKPEPESKPKAAAKPKATAKKAE